MTTSGRSPGERDRRRAGADLDAARRAAEAAAEPPAEAVAGILRQRARRFAQPLDAPRRSGPQLQLLVFGLGGALYGVNTAEVVEVVPLGAVIPVPCSPPFVLGVVSHRGQILAVIDPRALLELEVVPFGPGARIVVVAAGGMTFGLGVDGVRDVVWLDAAALVPVPSGPDGRGPALLRGMTGAMVSLLDLDALSRSGRIVVHEEVV